MTDNRVLITISGPPGSGTSTLANQLSEHHNYEVVSGGDMFREMAEERDMSLSEFTSVAEENSSIDRELDDKLAELMASHMNGERECDGNGLVVDSRLAGWFSPDETTLRVWLRCPIRIRAERTEGREETPEELAEREESDAARYEEYYDIDITNTSIYDLVIDTQRLPPETVRKIVSEAVSNVRSVQKDATR